MSDRATENLRESLGLADTMLDLAERGLEGCQDDGCLLVYGIMRDCAYTIRRSAAKELREHTAAIPAASGAEGHQG